MGANAQQNPEAGLQALEGYLAFYQNSDHAKTGWAQLRLAQIYLVQKQQAKAKELLPQIKSQLQDDDRLKSELKKLEKQLKKV